LLPWNPRILQANEEQKRALAIQIEALTTDYERAQAELRATRPHLAELVEPRLADIQQKVLDPDTTVARVLAGQGPQLSMGTDSMGDSPEEALLRLEVQSRLNRALGDLPPHVRWPFVLHFIQEVGCEDVGKTFSITAANVRKRIQRARCLLRQKLGPACVGTLTR
jgi:RNA polymerase sigma factor (sigma-70 family)